MADILFVYNEPATFVRFDRDALRQRHTVTECYIRGHRLNPAALWKAVARNDLVFGWFASWHTVTPILMARCLDKPSVLVIGGYDLAKLPEIGYGHQRGGLKRGMSRLAMRCATRLVTNARYSQVEASENAGIPAGRVEVIYHGVPDPFGTLADGRRERLALTVGNVDAINLFRKGHEPFVRAAALLPDVRFTLVGGGDSATLARLKDMAPPNVCITGRVSAEDLLEHYRRASVYVQASAHEGFGMSVAEAMLAGCIPAVTRAGALPEVAGDVGVYAESQDPRAIADAIRRALDRPDGERQRARQRVLECFPPERREEGILHAVAQALNGGSRR